MQKLSRIKSPALKRAVIGLGLITAFGAGYQLNEAKWQQLAKEPEKKVRELSPAAFRMDEYTPEGVKIADLAAIDALPQSGFCKICRAPAGQSDSRFAAKYSPLQK